MPETSEMASNLKVQTVGKYDISSMQKFKSRDFNTSPMKKPNKVQIKKALNLKGTEITTHVKSKRKHSFGSYDSKFNGPPFKKRNKTGIVPPTKFLLGGNINDPLNLGSLADEEINRSLNELTPYSSPMPTPKHRTQVEVLIPTNINDPLNLNAGEDGELNFTSPKNKRRKCRKRKKHGSGEAELTVETATEDEKVDVEPVKVETTESEAVTPKVEEPRTHSKQKTSENKIVSPVIPQPGMRKRSNTYPRSSKDESVKEVSAIIKADSCTIPTKRPQKTLVAKKEGKAGKAGKATRFRNKDCQFQYGNYNRYYGYRNAGIEQDIRLQCMNRNWFVGKDVLDIGCNVGFLTLTIARDFEPRKIIGLDIDGKLISVARKNTRHYITRDDAGSTRFPMSLPICYGPLLTAIPNQQTTPKFPNNLFFIQGNYILDSDEQIKKQTPEYDTILCLSLTKWVHLNWGDEGLKRLFKRIYAQLRPGGRLILEPQAWASYTKKKKLTETTYHNYQIIQLKPPQFTEYLLSKEVGFTTCEVIDTPFNQAKGFRRPIQLFTKGTSK